WIEKNVMRISSIINTLRHFAEAPTTGAYESRDLKSIIDGALIFCKERMIKHHISVHVEEIPESIVIDCRWADIAQAVYNILVNAFDALVTSEASEKWVAISYRDLRDTIEIDISDNGPGIKPEVAQQMLVPFFTTKPPGSGMGLGLTVALD